MKTLELTFWDIYYKAYGFRPRHVDFTSWNEDTYNAGIALCLAYIAERERKEGAGRPLEQPTSPEQGHGNGRVA